MKIQIGQGKGGKAEAATIPADAFPASVSSRKHSGKAQKTGSSRQETPQETMTIDSKALLRQVTAGLRHDDTRGIITEATRDQLRGECPGWDIYTLHAEFETWVNADSNRTPANWQKAFIGWVKRHHEKHKHELRG
jgi:hypothetical protein